MVEFNEEFDKPSNSNQSDRKPSLPDEMLIAFHAFSTVPPECRLPYLLSLAGLDSSVIAHALNLRFSVVEKRIEETKDILIPFVVSLVDRELDRPNLEAVEESDRTESLFVRRMIETVPAELFEAYRRYRKNETVEEIAQQCGITGEEVVRFHRMTLLIFLDSISPAIRHLTEITSESPPPFILMLDLAEKAREIRQAVSAAVEAIDRAERESITKVSRDELLEMENLYFGLPAIQREPFELDAVEIGREEIADVLDIDPETVHIRLKKARRFLVRQMERLIASMLLKREKSPKAPRMRRQSYLAARALFQAIGKNDRKAYGLFVTTGWSHEEIGRQLNLDAEEVERRIRDARKIIRKRVLTTGILTARKGENIPTARKRILTRLRYVMALRKDHEQKKFLEVREAIQPLVHLTNSERYETALLFEKLDKDQRESYALCKGLEIDTLEVAEFLGFLESDVKSKIRSVHASFTDRLIQMIGGMLRIDSFQPDAPALPESTLETARIAWQFVGEKNEEIFRHYFASNDSEKETAEALGLDLAEVSDRIATIRSMLTVRAEMLLTSWLREREDGLMRAELILRDIPEREPVPAADSPSKRSAPEEPYDYNAFVGSELIEAKKTLRLLEYNCRETFILHAGAGLTDEKIADLLQIPVEVVNARIQDAMEMIQNRMRQMVLGMLRISWELPGAPRMQGTEFEAARAAFEFVPQQCRKAYVRSRVHGESVDEIAEKLHLQPDEVADRLNEADYIILTRATFFATAAGKQMEDGKPVAEELLGGPKKIRFPAEVWNKDSSDAASKTPQAVDSPSRETEQEKKKHRNPILAVSASVVGLFTQMGAAKPTVGTITLTGMVAGLPAFAAFCMSPILWIFSLFFTNAVFGPALIQTAPNVGARQWLVKQLFYLYSASFILPFTFPIILSITVEKLGYGFGIVGFLLFILYSICNITLFIRTWHGCRQWYRPDYVPVDRAGNAKYLSRLIKWGFFVDTAVLVLLLVLFVQDAVLFRIGKPESQVFLYAFAGVTFFIICFHTISLLTFLYFYRIAKDEAAFQKYKPTWLLKKTFWNNRWFEEFVRFIFFTPWMILTNLFHIFIVRWHIRGSSIEILVYSICWGCVWYVNAKWFKSDVARWVLILVVFFAQLIAHRLLRFYYY